MHSINVALAKHAGAHFARRCVLQNGLAIATCEELLESSTCAALRTICYPADVSQRVTPHMRQRAGRLAPADAPLSPCLPTDLRRMLQREPTTVATTSLAAAALTPTATSAQPSAAVAATLAAVPIGAALAAIFATGGAATSSGASPGAPTTVASPALAAAAVAASAVASTTIAAAVASAALTSPLASTALAAAALASPEPSASLRTPVAGIAPLTGRRDQGHRHHWRRHRRPLRCESRGGGGPDRRGDREGDHLRTG